MAIEAYARSAAETGRSRSTGVYGRSRLSWAIRRASSTSGLTSSEIDAGRDVDGDRVAVLDQRDQAAAGRLGGDVPDGQPAGAAGEPAVGDQRAGPAQAAALEERRRVEHLLHARAARAAPRSGPRPRRRPTTSPAQDASTRALLRLEDPGRAAEGEVLLGHAGGLDHAAVGARLPCRMARPPSARVGVGDGRGCSRRPRRCPEWTTGSRWRTARWSVPRRARRGTAPAACGGRRSRRGCPSRPATASSDGACTACTSRCSRPARSSSPRRAGMPPARCTSSMWYFGVFGATLDRHGTRREMASMSATPKSQLGLAGRGQQVQHGVGRAAHGHVERDRVLERRPGGDRPRQHRGVVAARSSGWPGRRPAGRPRRTAPCGRRGWPAWSRCRAGPGRSPRSGSSSSWR